MINICITGHRKLLYPDTVREQIRSSLEYFQARFKNKEPITAITAMASGSDTIFAEEALDLGIPVKAIFPFSASEYQKDFSMEEWDQVLSVINNKKRPVQLEIANQLSSFTEEARKNAYLTTGVQLVDSSDIVLAVWDGLPPGGKGGTADIVRYATAKNKELHIIKGLRQANEGILPVDDKLQTTFTRLDKAAIRLKWWFVQTWRVGIVAGVMAALFFACGLALKLDDPEGWHYRKFVLAVGEVVSLGISLLLLLVIVKWLKNKFLDNRRKAEYLRAVIWYRDAGIPVPPTNSNSFSPGKIILDMEIEAAKVITTITNLPHAKRMTWCLASMQAAYHKRKRIRSFTSKLEWTERCLFIIKGLFFFIVALNFAIECAEYYCDHLPHWLETLHPIIIFAWMALPPIYAALEGVKHFTEWKSHIAKSEKIIEELKKISETVIGCADADGVAKQAASLRNIMELENCSWAEWTRLLELWSGL